MGQVKRIQTDPFTPGYTICRWDICGKCGIPCLAHNRPLFFIQTIRLKKKSKLKFSSKQSQFFVSILLIHKRIDNYVRLKKKPWRLRLSRCFVGLRRTSQPGFDRTTGFSALRRHRPPPSTNLNHPLPHRILHLSMPFIWPTVAFGYSPYLHLISSWCISKLCSFDSWSFIFSFLANYCWYLVS